MTWIRLSEVKAVHKRKEIGIRSNSGAVYRLVRDNSVKLPRLSYNLYKGTKKVPTLMETAFKEGTINVQGVITRNCVILHKRDLGENTGKGVGFGIINVFARIAQELHRPFAITQTCNMGTVRALERVSDFRFQGVAHDIFRRQASVNREMMVYAMTFGEAGIQLSATRLKRPNICFEWRAGAYWLIDDRSAIISFALDGEGQLKLYKNLPSLVTEYTPDIPMGASFTGLTFNQDGTLSYCGKVIGYSIALNFQLSMICGKAPKPVEDMMVKV